MYYLGPASEYKKEQTGFDVTSAVINAYSQINSNIGFSCFSDLASYIKSKLDYYYKNIAICGCLDEENYDDHYAYKSEWEDCTYSIFNIPDDTDNRNKIIDKMIEASIEWGGPCYAGFSNDIVIIEASKNEEYDGCESYYITEVRFTYIHWNKD